MHRRSLVAVLAAIGALFGSGMPAASAAPIGIGAGAARPAAAFSSTIHSAATGTCVDVPGGTTDVNANVVGVACSGAAEQGFSFQPVAGQPAGTYNVVNAASGLCLAQFRFGIRQSDCLHTIPESTGQMWTLLTVDAAAHEYVFEPTNQVGDTPYRCMGATSTGPGTAILGKPFYTAGTPGDVFTVVGLS
ncbi:hypothetical protein ABH926_006254 [Catenulispora sp. GP43]|uniref:RICIN domain-containing protein n=1 Tax=Catenulispora sp. GP43 TaxID=3156263 RepID=UPI003513CBB3